LHVAADARIVDSLSAEALSGRLAQVAHNMAVHAVSSLGSLDNVTVLIVLLRGGPASCPIDVSQKVPVASSTSGGVGAGTSRTGDENVVPRNGSGGVGWSTGTAASSSSASGRDSSYSLYSSEDGKPDASTEGRIKLLTSAHRTRILLTHADCAPTAWRKPVSSGRQKETPAQSLSTYASSSATSGPSGRNTAAVAAAAPVGSDKVAKNAADADDIDDMLDFLNDDSNF
jgi:hypothetical protein